MRKALFSLLAACGTEVPADHAFREVPPPGRGGVQLAGPGVVMSGDSVTWSVTGDHLLEGDRVDFGFGTGTSVGAGICPFRLQTGGSLCLDVTGRVRELGTAYAENDGGTIRASLSAPLVDRPEQIYVQAFMLRGAESATSNVLSVQLHQPWPTLDGRLDDVEGAQDGHEGRLDSVEGTQLTHNTRLGDLETGQAGHDGRLDGVEGTQLTHNTRLGDLESGQTGHDGRLDDVELTQSTHNTRLGDLDVAVAAHALSLGGLDGRATELEGDVFALGESAGVLATAVSGLETALSTMELWATAAFDALPTSYVSTVQPSGSPQAGGFDLSGNARVGGAFTVGGTATATSFAGSGASLTGVNAASVGGATLAALQTSFAASNDARLTDARNPLSGSAHYIQQNPAIAQTGGFDVAGVGRVGSLYVGGVNVMDLFPFYRMTANQELHGGGASLDNWSINTGAGVNVAHVMTVATNVEWANRTAEERALLTAMGREGVRYVKSTFHVYRLTWTQTDNWTMFQHISTMPTYTVAAFTKLESGSISGHWAQGTTSTWSLTGVHAGPVGHGYDHPHPISGTPGSMLVAMPAAVVGWVDLTRPINWGWFPYVPMSTVDQ